jgi:hypothetical protein
MNWSRKSLTLLSNKHHFLVAEDVALLLFVIDGKNQLFSQGCDSQCSHTLKTANIKNCYDPRSRPWYYKDYNRAF